MDSCFSLEHGNISVQEKTKKLKSRDYDRYSLYKGMYEVADFAFVGENLPINAHFGDYSVAIMLNHRDLGF